MAFLREGAKKPRPRKRRGAEVKQNVGDVDRFARFVFGTVIILAGIYFKSWFGLIGVIPLATGFIRWCPAYLPFGISTLREKDFRPKI